MKEDESEESMSLKSRSSAPRGVSNRDRNGRQLSDPLGLGPKYTSKQQQLAIPERDSRGFRLNKPSAPQPRR